MTIPGISLSVCRKCGETLWSRPKHEPERWAESAFGVDSLRLSSERLAYTCACGWVEYAPCKDAGTT